MNLNLEPGKLPPINIKLFSHFDWFLVMMKWRTDAEVMLLNRESARVNLHRRSFFLSLCTAAPPLKKIGKERTFLNMLHFLSAGNCESTSYSLVKTSQAVYHIGMYEFHTPIIPPLQVPFSKFCILPNRAHFPFGGFCSCLSCRPIQILLGNFPATFRILSNFFVREQLLATFWKTSTFLVTFGLFNLF